MKSLKESLLGDMETAVNNNCVYYPKNKAELIILKFLGLDLFEATITSLSTRDIVSFLLSFDTLPSVKISPMI